MTVIEQRVIPPELVAPIADLMTSFKLSVWITVAPTGMSPT